MKEICLVRSVKKEADRMVLEITENHLQDLEPTGRMLVDSDQFSFIYIMESASDYIYISLPENTWDTLNQGLKEDIKVILRNGETERQLTGFHEELQYLLSNIKDNANYGEEMMRKTADHFLQEE
ncbi:MAG: hypothetical protein ACI4XL_08520 [Bacillus sp. (in: firmicutes)]